MSQIQPSEEYVTVFTSTSSLDAGMVRGYLESHGLSVRMRDELMGSTPVYPGVAVRGIKVQVPSKDVEAAKEFLKQVDLSSTSKASRGQKAAKIFIGVMLVIAAAFFIFLVYEAARTFLS